MKILLATNNHHKIQEISEILAEFADQLKTMEDYGELPEPVENGKTYLENARIKALHYHRLTGIPTIADDSGLEIDAFNGEPGVHSARFIEPDMSYEERNKIILERMGNLPEDSRGARFRCCCVLVINENDIRTEYGVLEGKIGHEIRGCYGFGYDPIFVLPGRCLHLAELPPCEKNRVSHRAIAFTKIKKHLSV